MNLAVIHARTPGSVDATLNAVVATLSGRGYRPAGVMQEPSADGARHRCERDLIDIASGARCPISQKLGAGSRGCRLDPDAVETVAARVARTLEGTRADLLVINRFGKLEALGRGFCPVIADAAARAIPVLVGVNDLNRPAFEAFAAGMAVDLADTPAAVMAWLTPLLEKSAT